MSGYADWLTRTIIAERASVEPEAAQRALFMVAGTLTRTTGPSRLRQLLLIRLASLPYVQELVSKKPDLLAALDLPLEPTRVLFPGVFVDPQAYIESVIAAIRGENTTIVDRDGESYEVRPFSLISPDPTYPSVVFVSSKQAFIDPDFRLQFLTLDEPELTEKLTAHAAVWDLEHEAIVELGKTLSRLTPAERLKHMDDQLEGNIVAFYDRLSIRLKIGEPIAPYQILPGHLDGLIRYFSGNSPNPEARAEALLSRLPLIETVKRLIDLPAPIPAMIVARFDALERRDKRDILRRLSRCARTPISLIHFLRLMLRSARDVETRQRVVGKYVASMMKSVDQVDDFLRVVRWIETEMGRMPSSLGFGSPTVIATAWVHASQVVASLGTNGITIAEIANIIQTGRQFEQYTGPQAMRECAMSSRNTSSLLLLVCALHNAVADFPELFQLFNSLRSHKRRSKR
jgi:hypothetical protein